MNRHIMAIALAVQTVGAFAWTRIEGTLEEIKAAVEKSGDSEIELVVTDKNPDLKQVREISAGKRFKLDLTACERLETIPAKAFLAENGLESVVLPDGLRKIGAKAFSRTGLKTIVIPNSVSEIGDFAFSQSALKGTVKIPKAVEKIGVGAFTSCKNLSEFSVESANPNFRSDDRNLMSKDGQTLVQFPAGRKGEYSVPTYVTRIGAGAFEGAKQVTNIVLPENLLTIGGYAFHECTSLDSITIPENVVRIGSDAIGGTKIKRVYIPKSVQSLGEKPFEGATELESITVEKDSKGGFVSKNGVLFDSDSRLVRYPPKKSGSEYVVPENTKSIAIFAFADATELEKVVFKGTEIVGKYAFRNGGSLTSLENQDSLKEIGREAFWGTEVKRKGSLPSWYRSRENSKTSAQKGEDKQSASAVDAK